MLAIETGKFSMFAHIFNRISGFIEERGRYFWKKREMERLCRRLNLPLGQQYDFGTLLALASVRAHLGHPVDILIDVGAHLGRFVLPAYHVLGANRAICFEPNPNMLPTLGAAISSLNAVCRNVALSDTPGNLQLHVHQDASMSSLLTSKQSILETHFNTYDTRKIEQLNVAVSTLDLELKAEIANGNRFFLKLDTQGNELDVLKGGVNFIQNCDGVMTEYMFTTPYTGQSEFEELIDLMREKSFFCAATLDIKRKPTFRVSGVDFLFLRKDQKL